MSPRSGPRINIIRLELTAPSQCPLAPRANSGIIITMPVNATPYHRKQFMTLLLSNLCFLCLCARADLWVTGYYPGYQQGVMAATNIDFTTITHVVHFALVPNSDGSLNS